jgi:tetratricopeptide (TPR) repeat protein
MGQVLLVCQGLDALAHWHMQAGDPQAALTCVEEAVDAAALTDSRLVQLFVGPRHAEAQLAVGNPPKAAELAHQAVLLAREVDARHYLAVTRRVLGQILAVQAEWDAAAGEFEAAVAGLDELGSRLELGRTLYHQGEMQALRGEHEAAHTSLERALAIFDACSAEIDMGRARTALEALAAGFAGG